MLGAESVVLANKVIRRRSPRGQRRAPWLKCLQTPARTLGARPGAAACSWFVQLEIRRPPLSAASNLLFCDFSPFLDLPCVQMLVPARSNLCGKFRRPPERVSWLLSPPPHRASKSGLPRSVPRSMPAVMSRGHRGQSHVLCCPRSSPRSRLRSPSLLPPFSHPFSEEVHINASRQAPRVRQAGRGWAGTHGHRDDEACDLLMCGLGGNGQLGLADEFDRTTPALVARALTTTRC